MKAITVRLPEQDLKFLQSVKDAGFSSVSEVIKCAALSLVNAAPRSTRRKTTKA